MSQKGGSYERDVCRTLSLWWTNDARDDCFWRSATSGGRATIRRKSGKTTANQCGDICATDAYGLPFLRYFTPEIKRGYNKIAKGRKSPKSTTTINDWMDRPHGTHASTLEDWVWQAYDAHKAAGSLAWMLIHQRDNRNALVYMPTAERGQLFLGACRPRANIAFLGFSEEIFVVTLASFIVHADPDRIRYLVRQEEEHANDIP